MSKLVLLLGLASAILVAALLAAAQPAQATFPGANGRIAFGSDRYGGTHNIFTMNADGSDVRQLTFVTAEQGAALDQNWSPDGRLLAYNRRSADFSVRAIFLMNADGSDQHVLVDDPSYVDLSPRFSPDGSRVIFSRCRRDFEACAIYTVKTDGHGLTAITHLADNLRNNVLDFRPGYSPDGTTIAFGSINRGGVLSAIYLMNPHGSNVRRITPAALEAFDLDWAPDGAKLVFASPCCTPQPPEIWTVNSDGSDLTQFTLGGTNADAQPSYSPQGDKIAFTRNPTGQSGSILTMNADGTGLTTIQPDAFFPRWGPAG
jgi:Tol biopolymer transport system component